MEINYNPEGIIAPLPTIDNVLTILTGHGALQVKVMNDIKEYPNSFSPLSIGKIKLRKLNENLNQYFQSLYETVTKRLAAIGPRLLRVCIDEADAFWGKEGWIVLKELLEEQITRVNADDAVELVMDMGSAREEVKNKTYQEVCEYIKDNGLLTSADGKHIGYSFPYFWEYHIIKKLKQLTTFNITIQYS